MNRRHLILATLPAATILVVAALWSTGSDSQVVSRETSKSASLPSEIGTAPSLSPTAQSTTIDGIEREATPEPATIEGDGAYSAVVGSRFEFELRTESEVQFGDSVEGIVGNALAGTQSTTVLARRGDQLVVELRFDVDAEIRGGAEGAEDVLEHDLKRPVLLRMTSDGTVLGLRFAPEVARTSRDAVRSLVASFRFVIRPGSAWESSDAEPNGIAKNGYRWTDRSVGRVERTKLAFESLSQFADIGGAPQLVGSADAKHDAKIGWLADARYDETMGEAAGGLLPVRGSSRGSLTLVRREVVAIAECTPIGWGDAWESLHASAEVETDGAGLAFERRHWSERLKGVTLSYAMSSLELLCRQDPVDTTLLVIARQDLEWLLRLEPSNLDLVDALVGSVDPNAAQILLTAVGRVGDARCQQILVRNASDGGRTDDVRRASLFAMVGVKHPTSDTLAGLERMIAPSTGDRAAPVALLVAGALVGLTTEGDAILGALMSARPVTNDPALLADWVAALGNTKHPQVKDLVAQYVAHPNEVVRNAALAAWANVAPLATK